MLNINKLTQFLFVFRLKYYRKHLLWKTYTGLHYCAVAPPDKRVANICADEPQVIQYVIF